MTDTKVEKLDEPVPNITNDEKPEVNTTVNKKLTEMSKEAKTRTKKRKLQKPPKDTGTTVSTLTNNQMYMLLAVIGVVIAGASLYYQRKSVVKDEKPEVKSTTKPETPPEPVLLDLTPGMYSF